MPLNSTRGAGSSRGFGFGADNPLGPALFTVATGGTITTSGNFKIHTFTGPGTFTVTSVGKGPTNPLGGPNTLSYLVLAGGGGNGGGAGGYREGRDITPSYTASPKVAPTGLTLTSKGSFPVTVGAGGNAAGPNVSPGTASKGNNSVFLTITAAGGGASIGPSLCSTNRSGGSGAGGNGSPEATLAGNTPPVAPPQGNPGGPNRCGQSSSGGGGAGGPGFGQGGVLPNNWPYPGPCNQPGGGGGVGTTTSITGSPLSYAGGGGGDANVALGLGPGPASPCGTGGKGVGGPPTTTPVPAAAPNGATNGTTNRGGGGGAGGNGCGKGAGGSGIVVIRYKFQ